MRLAEIVLYSYDDRVRTLSLRPDGLNIITGESNSGKSAIIHIIDYCLASKECHIPLGKIRDKVKWYAIRLVSPEFNLFVARKNPEPGRKTSSEIYLDFQKESRTPSEASLVANSNVDGLRATLGSLVGLRENLHVPPEGHTRDALEANFRHGVVYCFQDQSIVDSKNQLFFSAQDPFVKQAIRDTLPFFLGAVDENEVLKQAELNLLKRELRQLERRLSQAENWKEISNERAQAYLAEARQVRLVASDFRPVDPESVIAKLQEVPDLELEEEEFIEPEEELYRLEEVRDTLRDEYFSIGRRIEDALNLSVSRNEYGRELLEQKARLSLAPSDFHEEITCPVCLSTPSEASGVLEGLVAEVNDVSARIAELHSHGPRLQRHITELEKRQAELRARIGESQAQINRIINTTEALRHARDLRSKQARVQGRISAFLDQRSSTDEIARLQGRAEELRNRIEKYESALSGESYFARLRNAESILEDLITAYTKELQLEHATGRTRLDIRRLTVVSETRSGSIPLEDMGSGDNWVGCHVATHMALHQWFREKSRPVPSFIVFDQPSKAHYPPELDTLSDVKDDDRRSVVRLFKFLLEKSAMAQPFQTIVLDHADEKDQWFQASVVERWRDGKKLVPEEWSDR